MDIPLAELAQESGDAHWLWLRLGQRPVGQTLWPLTVEEYVELDDDTLGGQGDSAETHWDLNLALTRLRPADRELVTLVHWDGLRGTATDPEHAHCRRAGAVANASFPTCRRCSAGWPRRF